MPIYEFDCRECGTTFDKLVRNLAAVDDVTCPECAGTYVKKKLSLFSNHGAVTRSSSSVNASGSCSPGGL